MTAAATAAAPYRPVSVFAGYDVCRVAGLALTPGSPGPVYDEEVWVLTGLADAHRMVKASQMVWDFTTIADPRWRPVVKDVLLAMLAPRQDSVLALASAVRTPRSPLTCHDYLWGLAAWLNWLTARGVRSLTDVDQHHCDAYLHEQAWSVPDDRGTRRRLHPASVSHLVRCVQAVAVYGDLFASDRYRPGFVPWQGRSANTVSGNKPRKGENATPTVSDAILAPLLANCLYLIDVIGPHVADLVEQARVDAQAHQRLPWWLNETGRARLRRDLRQRVRDGQPLPQLDDTFVDQRLRAGWSATDPLLRVNLNRLVRDAGCGQQLPAEQLPPLRPDLHDTVAHVGVAGRWGRDAALVAHARSGEPIPWTVPLCDREPPIVAQYLVTACLILTAAVSGMRRTELAELVAGCRSQSAPLPGGGRRFRLASRLIKGQRFGGVADEWVVVAEVDRAVALAERLTGAADGQPLFGDAQIAERYANLRRWLAGPFAARLGLAPPPDGPVNAKMLRRTLALELSRRPGGLFAAKIHLRHVSVVTTEGYAHRPGGSQALFHTEIQQLELEHHIQLTVEAFRAYRNGVMPAGPGAQALIEVFAHVDAELTNTASGAPAVLDNDRRIENLLRQQAGTLHLATANYCWFRDPAKALCLKLAGTPTAPAPLAAMCDSARCPQATHHPCHRPVWAETVRAHTAFLGAIGRAQPGERQRLQVEITRAQRVVDAIDATAPPAVSAP